MIKEESRTKKSILNIGSNFSVYMIKVILSFIVRTIFIKVLGETYLGVNGLLTNILSMLSLAELGIGTAINFSLYKPLAEKNKDEISALMSFYKKVYMIIGLIVAILGIILFFFLGQIIKDASSIKNLDIIYILYLFNMVSTYFISYKETLINADQKAYRLVRINFLCTTLLYILEIMVLLIFRNFIIYLITQFLVMFSQKAIVNRFITKTYKEIDFVSKNKIPSKVLDQIKVNIKAMIFHKVGDYCVNSTDNIIISRFIGLGVVGIYSNYQILLSIIQTFVNMVYTGIIASLGNLVATETKGRKKEAIEKLDFIGFLIYSTLVIVMLYAMNPFIKVWIGDEYILPMSTVKLILVNFYLTGMRVPMGTIKGAAGLYKQDKYTPIIQSIINIVVSIVLVVRIGLNGVLIGTVISGILPSLQRPYIVYKYLLGEKNIKKYYVDYLKYLLVMLISIISIFSINKFIVVLNGFIYLIIIVIISVVIHLGIILIFYRKTKEFKYLLEIIKKIFIKIKTEVKNKWKKD